MRRSVWHSWRDMNRRCTNQEYAQWKDYGGRGISVCERWSSSYENFLADMGIKPFSKAQIDRIDNNGNYEPSNCHWVTRAENSRNKRSNRIISSQGETLILTDWAEKTGISESLIRHRLDVGWSTEEALNPVTRRRKGSLVLSFNGETLTVMEWSKKFNIDSDVLYKRVTAGWSAEDALTRKVKSWLTKRKIAEMEVGK